MHRTTNDHAAINGTDADPERLAYSVKEAAQIIGISARRLWDHVRNKKIRTFREGTRRLVSRRAIEEFITEREADEERAA